MELPGESRRAVLHSIQIRVVFRLNPSGLHRPLPSWPVDLPELGSGEPGAEIAPVGQSGSVPSAERAGAGLEEGLVPI